MKAKERMDLLRLFIAREFLNLRDQNEDLIKSRNDTNCRGCLLKMSGEKLHTTLMCMQLTRIFLATLEDESKYERAVHEVAAQLGWTDKDIEDLESTCKSDIRLRASKGPECTEVMDTEIPASERHKYWEIKPICKPSHNIDHLNLDKETAA